MIKWKIVANNKPVDARWGIRMLVHALEVDKNRELLNKGQIEQDLIDLTTTWDKRADEKLTQWINSATRSLSFSPHVIGSLHLAPQSIQLSKNELVRLTELNSRTQRQLSLRYCLLRSFNRRLNNLLNLVDLSRSDLSWSIASKVRDSSYMIFADVKSRFLNKALVATSFRVMRPYEEKAAHRNHG